MAWKCVHNNVHIKFSKLTVPQSIIWRIIGASVTDSSKQAEFKKDAILHSCACVCVCVFGLGALEENIQKTRVYFIYWSNFKKIARAGFSLFQWSQIAALFSTPAFLKKMFVFHLLFFFLLILGVPPARLRRRCHYVASVGVAAGGFISVSLSFSPALSTICPPCCSISFSLGRALSLFYTLYVAFSAFFPCSLHLSFLRFVLSVLYAVRSLPYRFFLFLCVCMYTYIYVRVMCVRVCVV